MIICLVVLFGLINLYVIWKYYKYNYGVFQAPFLIACGSIVVFIPQITSYYVSDYYDNSILPRLLVIMCMCNLGFEFGFSKAKSSRLPNTIRNIDLKASKKIVAILSIAGMIAAFSIRGVWMNELENKSNFIVMVNLANYQELGFIFFLVYLLKVNRKDKFAIAIVVVAGLLYLETILLLGRRNLSLRLMLNILIILVFAKPIYYKHVRKLLLMIFLFGSIINASIQTIRMNMGVKSSEEINFASNFEDSFAQTDFEVGMDIGNAAMGVDFCYRNDSYDYGISIWNKFIFNYVPKFLVGQDLKNNLQVPFEYDKIIPYLTHDVTTMTGYFDAFASFSFFGFIEFILLGYILGLFWKWSFVSDLYLIIYMFLFTQAINIFTHSPQYIYIRLEFFALFFLPFLGYHIYKTKKQSYNFQ